MKKYYLKPLLIAVSLFIYSVSSAQFREKYTGGNVNDDIKGMSFISPSTGFVAFTNFIGFTQDSGASYIQRAITTGNTNFNGYSVNITLGFIPTGVAAFSVDSLFTYGNYSAEPSILFSANQGQTWKLVYHDNVNGSSPDIYNKIFDLKFPVSSGNIAVAVQHDKILRSSDRGQSWSLAFSAGKMERLNFPSSGTGFATAGNNLYKTINGGVNWVTSNTPLVGSSYNYNNIFFVSNTLGYVSESTASAFYRTVNGGTSWTKTTDETLMPVNGSDLIFINDSTGFLCKEFSYQVYKTSDSGKVWEPCKKNSNFSYLGYG
ncbi:MAG: hypothetical protein ABJA78_19035, partial [Ferruginibacter sp.]